LESFPELHLSVIANEISVVSNEFCAANELAKSATSFFNDTENCDGFLCAPGSSNIFGRGVDLNNPCEPCAQGEAPFYGSVSCDAHPDELTILVELFEALQGEDWDRNDYWLSKASFCDWYGVACDNGHVASINLVSNNLKGSVPSEIFHLPKLQLLWLSSNQIQISFEEIGRAENLLDLRLESTGLRSIDGINGATLLTALSVASNNLSGPFPQDLLRLENLRYLAMNSNTLTGSIPEVEELRYLRYLQLDNNLFNQKLPSFSKSVALIYIRLAGNELTGDIPIDFLESVPASSLVRVDLSNNRLSGEVPEEISRLDRLSLTLKQNQITSLPPSLCEKRDWNDGDVGKYGCDGIMCQPGTSTLEGRQQGNPCVYCPQADSKYYGQALCDSTGSSSISVRRFLRVITSFSVATAAMLLLM